MRKARDRSVKHIQSSASIIRMHKEVNDYASFLFPGGPARIRSVKNIFTMVLAGGKGERLFPLTDQRAKPAVPFGGKYRIIDFTLSNCINSGLRKIVVLIQYKSHSLDRHIRIGWNVLNAELGEYIASVPPQQRISEDWYRGTADAVYQNIYTIEKTENGIKVGEEAFVGSLSDGFAIIGGKLYETEWE